MGKISMSELYDLPNGWEWKTLDECTDKIIDGNYGESYPTKDEFIDSGIPFLTAAAIGVNGKIEYEKIKYISNEKHSILTKAQTTIGDVILVNRGVKNDFSNISSIIEDEYFRISNISPQLTKLKTNTLLKPKYLYFYFYSEPFLNQFIDLTMGSALRFISLTKTKKIEIPLPPLSEQQRIVSKLDLLFQKIDKSIELHQKNMDESDAFMGSVLNEVFGELGEKYGLNNLLDGVYIGCKRGFNPTIIDGKVPFIGMSDIDEKSGLNTQFVMEDYEKVSNGKTKFEKNAVLVGKIFPCTQNNKTSIVPNYIDGGFATTEVYALHCLDNMNPLYLNQYMRSNSISDYMVSTMVGATGRQRVPSETIKSINIPIPPLQIQQKVVIYLDEISQKIEKIKQLQKEKMASLKALKASILDSAFRGEL